MWQEVLHLLSTLPQKDTMLLRALEPLLVAGFSCPHKEVVNETIVFWNASFGAQETLEYPTRLERTLRARSMEAELSLPTFPESCVDDDCATLPAFFETQVEVQPQPLREQVVTGARDTARIPSSAPVVPSTHYSARKDRATRRPAFSPVTNASSLSVRSTTKARLRHDDSQVDFAPIESSPIHYEDSQMLTERQKEVKSKQRDNAQIFPDLSSSPIAMALTPARNIHKRLDFTSDTSHGDNGEGSGTPQALHEGEGPIGDDILSSPTPSSTKGGDSARIDFSSDDNTDVDEAADPPSSPPEEQDEFDEADVQIESKPNEGLITIDALVNGGETKLSDRVTDAAMVSDASERHPDMAPRCNVLQGSDLPSDTLLPTEQLLHEENMAARVEEVVDDIAAAEDTTLLRASATSVEQSFIEKSDDRALTAAVESTVVEDSFVGTPATDHSQGGSDSKVGSQQSQRSGKKRKRSASSNFTSKKRKQQSPLKQAINFFASWGRTSQQQDEDDDMEDEIVVASSQPRQSPALASAQQASSPLSKPEESTPELTEHESVLPIEDDPTPSQRTRKRGRGRPRKSETPTPALSLPEVASAKTVKRRASALSIASGTYEPASSSFVKETPAPSRAQKKRRGPDTNAVQPVVSTQDGSELGRTTRRTLTAVVLPEGRNEEQTDRDEDAETSVTSEQTPERAALTQQSTVDNVENSLPSRPTITPRSILARLREVLADIPKMIMGPQDEREMCDVVFEISREAHEAARRARQ